MNLKSAGILLFISNITFLKCFVFLNIKDSSSNKKCTGCECCFKQMYSTVSKNSTLLFFTEIPYTMRAERTFYPRSLAPASIMLTACLPHLGCTLTQ